MPSSTSSSRRLTAADRPGVAQPVPVRDVPERPWRAMFAIALTLTVALWAGWEWQMRRLELTPGDLGDSASAWAEQRRRVYTPGSVVILGDSRILFDTDLNRFSALTGVRPIQLALAGTNARPFLEDLAADRRFNGLVIVGIAETSYFRKEVGLQKDALARFHYESPAQRSSFLLNRALRRGFAFLDEDYRLSNLVARLDPGWRVGARGPYDDVWKLSDAGDERQTWLWPRIEHDARLRAHARAAWRGASGRGIFTGKPVAAAIIAMTLETTRTAVSEIRARGGEVVFVRPPSAPQLRSREDLSLPRAKGWDALLVAAKVRGVHFDDDPAMQGLSIPEFSHLSRACATVFTDAYVRRLATITTRVRLRSDAPPPLAPRDCGGPAAHRA